MNIGGIQFPTFVPYEKAALEIYISGCTRKCKGCHNPDLWDFNFGKELVIEELLEYMDERKHLFSIISLTGGDLLCQDEVEAMHLVSTLKLIFPEKEFWLFTGEELENCPGWTKILFDKIKTGIYNDSNKTNGFPSSGNQKLNIKNKDY